MQGTRRLPFAWPRLALLAALVLLPARAALAAPDIADKFTIGSGGGTDHKPQSKLWFNDGTWWAIAYDGNSQRIWKFDGGLFVKQTYPDAAVDSRATSRADVLWDGTNLYVLSWHDVTPRFSKYSYDSSTQTYARLPGFPVDLAIPGTEVMVFDQDSTGRLWAAFELAGDIRVIWSVSPDHLSWNTTGIALENHVDSDDIATVVAFGGNSIGVLWSDQSADAPWQFGFRVHRDTDAPEIWQPIELIDSDSAVDDHINAKAAPDGRIYLAAKDLHNHIELYVRETTGGWIRAASDINAGTGTRPIVQVETTRDLIHVFYTDWETSPNAILMATAPRSTLVFGTPELYLAPGGLSLNDVTGTKQPLSARTGIMAMASSSSSAYWGFINLDTDAPVATGIDPADGAVGIPVQPLVQVRLTDAGMGVRRNSIVMTVDGVQVTPTTAGDATEYLLTWMPSIPLENGRIYTVSVFAEDYAYPPHSDTSQLRFRTEMVPGPLAKKINFQPATGAVPPGYEVDSGSGYTLDSGTGWNKSMTERRANVEPDIRLDTHIERKNSSTRATWAYDLPNGLYRVTFSLGSPTLSGKHRVEIEGEELVSSQSTAAGQYITISDYPIAVRDGKLEVKIGGAGSSNYTRLCYIDFTYEGEAPPPPPSGGDEPAPQPVTGLALSRSGSDILLNWNAVTHDTTGALIAVTSYHIYRGTTPGFVPDQSGHSNRVGVVASPSFTDLGAANLAGSLYYRVTAERASGQESAHSSNLGVRRSIALTPPTGSTLTTWIALPYSTSYGNAQGLATSWNGGTGAGPVVALSRIERTTQTRQTWTRASGSWTGTNFALVPGEALEVTVASPLAALLVGSESSDPAYGFAFHVNVSNLSWISLPQNTNYADARGLVEAMNGGTGPGPITKIAWLNPATASMESYLYFAGGWRGTNFTLQPGNGLAVLAGADLLLWKPRLVEP